MIRGESIFSYHADPAISWSKLSVFMGSPLDFYERFVLKVRGGEQTEAMGFGSAYHLLMEGEDIFQAGVALTDKWKTLKGEAAQDWVAEQRSAGKIGLLASDIPTLRKMEARVKAHKVVQQLIEGTEAELTWRKSFGKFTVQCRTDRFRDSYAHGDIVRPLAIDWKTCESVDGFKKSVVDWGYHCQNSFYEQVMMACMDRPADAPVPLIVFVAVEKSAPFEVQPFVIGGSSMDLARGQIFMALRRLKHCYETGVWTRPEDVETIDLPRWYAVQQEELLLKQRARLELEAT